MSEEEKNTASEEKKEGKISGFFKKAKSKLDDATFESRLKGSFEKNHTEYRVYTGTGFLSSPTTLYAEEHIEEGFIIVLGEDEITVDGLIRNEKTKHISHMKAIIKTTIEIPFEEATYERPAQKILLGDDATKVDVIKVNDDYYLK